MHLRVSRESVTLVEAALFDLNESEAQALVASLNAHFAADGPSFHCFAPKRWYVRAQGAPQVRTASVAEVAGQDIQMHLPTGADAREWHRIFNEVQMLLHGHAVNEARESAGAPPVNSVWFWGGGTRPRVPGRPFARVWSNEPLASALAVASDTRRPRFRKAALHGSSQPVASARATSSCWTRLRRRLRITTWREWRARLLTLEARWFAPLAEALTAGTHRGARAGGPARNRVLAFRCTARRPP